MNTPPPDPHAGAPSAPAPRLDAPLAADGPVPDAVPRAYLPSGRSTPLAPLYLVLGGVAGVAAGFGAAHVARWLAEGVFGILEGAGGCLAIVYYPAVAIYYLSPLLVPLGAGGGMVAGVRLGRSRDPAQVRRLSAVVAALSALPVVWMAAWLGERAEHVLALGGLSLWTAAVVAVAALLTWPAAAVVFGLVMAGAGFLLIRGIAGDAVESMAFCEGCAAYLESAVLARHPVETARPAVAALLAGDAAALSSLPRLPAEADASAPRLEVTHSHCGCGDTHYVEAVAHWSRPPGAEGGKPVDEERRVFSALLGAAEAEALRAAYGDAQPGG